MRVEARCMPTIRIVGLLVLSLLLVRIDGFSFASAPAPRSVTLTLGAIDDISGLYMMQIAEDTNNPPAPVPYSVSYTLTTAATMLYVRVEDRALNWSAWVAITVGGAPVVNHSTYPSPTVTQSSSPSPSPSPIRSSGGSSGGYTGGAPMPPAPPIASSPSTSPSSTSTPTPSETPSSTITQTSPSSSSQQSTPQPSPSPSPSPTPTASLATPGQIATHVSSIPIPVALAQPTIPVSANIKKQVATSTYISLPEVQFGASTIFSIPQSRAASISTTAKVGEPLSITIPTQPKGTLVSFSFIGPNKKVITLVSITLKNNGRVNLPSLAFKAAGKYTLQVKIGKITKTLVVTVKK